MSTTASESVYFLWHDYAVGIFKTHIMPILTIIIVIVLVGLALWFVDTYIPMNSAVKRILQAVVVLVLIIWLLQVFGVLGSLNSARIK